MDNPRQSRGLIIAACHKLVWQGGVWLVPSQSSARKVYQVDVPKQTCNCPDCADSGNKCKHIFAAEIVIQREFHPNGTVVETASMTLIEKKKHTDLRDWPIYNLAKQTGTRWFKFLLHELCKGLKHTQKAKTGRPLTPLADMAYACVYKVFRRMSSRDFQPDLDDVIEKRFISSKTMNSVEVCKFMKDRCMTETLHWMIIRSSWPLRHIETRFGVDSTGFSTNCLDTWCVDKHGLPEGKKDKDKRKWVKAHIISGADTHIITHAQILDQHAADCPQFKDLVAVTSAMFTIDEVYADKAYLSLENLKQVDELCGTPYIQFKDNSVAHGGGNWVIWDKMLYEYQNHREEYNKHYHQRSQVEATISMFKRLFRDYVMSKTEVARRNEALCKFVCHNLFVLIMAMHTLNIQPKFWKDEAEGDVHDVREALPTESPKTDAGYYDI
jgi:transposase